MAMSKSELIELINSTIKTNGAKGISAQSLNNTLLEMVESSGEGSGSGALTVYGEDSLLGTMLFNAEFTPEKWEELLPTVDSTVPGISSGDYAKAVEMAFAHNADVYNTIVEKAKSQEGMFLMLDLTPTMLAAVKAFGDTYGKDTSNSIVTATLLAEVGVTIGAEFFAEDSIAIYPLDPKFSHLVYKLLPNGGLIAMDTETGSTGGVDEESGYYVIYTEGETTLSEEEKESNKAYRNLIYNQMTAIFEKPFTIKERNSSISSSIKGYFNVIGSNRTNTILYIYMEPYTSDIALYSISFSEDGNTVVSKVKSLITNS